MISWFIHDEIGCVPAARIFRPCLSAKRRDRAAQASDLGARLGHGAAGPRADLDDALVHLGLDLLAQDHLAALKNLGDIRAQLARLGIDDLVFLFDADREGEIGRHGVVEAHYFTFQF